MLKALLILLAGIALGAIGVVGFALLPIVLAPPDAAVPSAGPPPSNAARDDTTDCPEHGPEVLLGTWAGEKYFPAREHTQIWRAERFSDGTFVLEFMDASTPDTVESTETGYWSYSRCIYTTVIRTLNDKPVHFQEVYRVHHVDDRLMRYTNYRSGNTYELRRTQ